MTTPTEEERKAAAQKVMSRMDLAAPYSDVGDLLMDAACDDDFGVASSLAIDLQIQLTRTEKLLELAGGIIEQLYGCPKCGSVARCFAAAGCDDAWHAVNPPAEGE